MSYTERIMEATSHWTTTVRSEQDMRDIAGEARANS